MKTKSILFSLLFAATAFAFLTNCSGNKKEDLAESHEGHDGKEHASGSAVAAGAAEPQFQVDGKFQEQLASVFTSYVALKDALVTSDAAKAKTEAADAKDALAKVDMKLLSGAAHNDWMSYLSPIETSLKEIGSSTDLEAQRKSFSTLSDNLYKSIKAFGLGGKQAFYEFCPMAFNNEGGYWLSDQEQIRNPYFGDKMLTCGEVKEKLK
ncbi:DUF3347 domain-containing protein [Fulvivirgaceae bacterium PWU4]|uniref:DUF3347 domain-containing protein n=1 Tax=Chryseosolibacter histidini TaxID=2782349 RepID=A0AAP2DQS1_9BACT|nr:DUF3347 domain-containing protein [Chryseosolibacter histidini]MBT1699282.1 DUF3347 domain-containing protein [Chryseosolibacter histidini]